MRRPARIPASEWPRRYFVGTTPFIHALGVIAATYNSLEFQFHEIFRLYTRLQPLPARYAFSRMSNDARLAIVALAIEHSTHPRRVKNRLDRFLRGFRICTENRNILMHSETVPIIRQGTLQVQFKKVANQAPFRSNIYSPSLDALRQVADSTFEYGEFGKHLFRHVIQTLEPAFLDAELAALPPYRLPNPPDMPAALQPKRRPGRPARRRG